MRPRLTYANVAATIALVFSMSGGALAANHFLITSAKQISPKVLKKLVGPRGAVGAPGAPGKEGPVGKDGASGKEGTPGKEGPRAPSNGYEAYQGGHIKTPVEEPAVVGSLAVPAGNYLAVASVLFENEGASRAVVECQLVNSADKSEEDIKAATIDPTTEGIHGRSEITLQVAPTLAQPGQFHVVCESTTSEIIIEGLRIQAQAVGSLEVEGA